MIRVITKKPGMANLLQIEEIESGVKALQLLVDPDRKPGASFECPYLPKLAEQGIDIWINENGKFLADCTANFQIFDGLDTIMGPVVFTSHDDEGRTTGLSDAQVEFVKAFLDSNIQSIF